MSSSLINVFDCRPDCSSFANVRSHCDGHTDDDNHYYLWPTISSLASICFVSQCHHHWQFSHNSCWLSNEMKIAKLPNFHILDSLSSLRIERRTHTHTLVVSFSFVWFISNFHCHCQLLSIIGQWWCWWWWWWCKQQLIARSAKMRTATCTSERRRKSGYWIRDSSYRLLLTFASHSSKRPILRVFSQFWQSRIIIMNLPFMT